MLDYMSSKGGINSYPLSAKTLRPGKGGYFTEKMGRAQGC